MAIDGGLRGIFITNLPQWDWQSIESASTGPGIPDLNGCFQGTEVWIEHKVTSGWAVAIDKEQCVWLRRRARAGGRTFVGVRRLALPGVRRQGADELWLIRGEASQELRKKGLKGVGRDDVLGVWTGGPRAWDWEKVFDRLVS